MAKKPVNAEHPASVLALEVFGLNGALIAAGDTLVAPLGLTSARWQVMGAIAQADGALSASQIARNMGLARQSVQRLVNELEQDGIVRLQDNPDHKRAKQVLLTARGSALLDNAMTKWKPLADLLVRDLAPRRIEQAIKTLRHVRNTLESEPIPGQRR